MAGQLQVTYGYDDAHRLSSITQGTSVVAFTYDDADRRTTLTVPNGIVTTYGYDNANKLASLTYTLGQTALGTLTYTYDAAGNRTSVGGTWARTGLPQTVTSASYDAGNRLVSWNGEAFSYDLNGNLASDGSRTFTWNARNQLTGLSGGTSASFAYDGVGWRRGKTINGSTTNFLYDGLTFVQEQSSGGTPTANLLTGMSIDEVFRRTDSGGARDPLIDALGSALALADGSSAVQTSYTYEPFGVTSVSGATSTNAGQFTGRENDGTGLCFYRARYYSPGFQRFVEEDPLDFQGGSANLYSYVHNNPINLLDPLGLWVRNLDPNRSVPVKPEDGPWGKLPPCSEWPGSPDGLLDPGSTAGRLGTKLLASRGYQTMTSSSRRMAKSLPLVDRPAGRGRGLGGTKGSLKLQIPPGFLQRICQTCRVFVRYLDASRRSRSRTNSTRVNLRGREQETGRR